MDGNTVNESQRPEDRGGLAGLRKEDIQAIEGAKGLLSQSSLGDPTRAFESSKFSKSVATVLEKSGAKDSMTYTQGEYAYAIKNLEYSSWKMTINNPTIVALVKKDTEVQNAVLAGTPLPPQEKTLKSSYEAALERTGVKDTPIAPKVVEEVKSEAKPEEKVLKSSYEIALERMDAQAASTPKVSQEVTPEVTSATKPEVTPKPIFLSENRFDLPKEGQEATPTQQTRGLSRFSQDPDRRINMSSVDFIKEFGTRNLEKVGEGLEQRKEGALKRLAGLGLTKLPEALEVFKNVKPRYKLAMGLTLAGASFVTGGLTSILSTGLSTLSYSSGFYAKMLEAEKKKNGDVKKEWVAARALTYGFVAALASSALIGQIVSHTPEGVVDAVKEKVSSVKDGLKEWFVSFTSTPPVPSLESMPINGLTMDDGMTMNSTETVSAAESFLPGESLVAPDIMVLPDHVIQPGENIIKIIREQVLSTIPGVESLTEFQKNNMIENFLKQTAENKDASYYDAINKFTNPNLIQPGQTLNLTQIRDGLTGYTFNQFGGQTLLEHAKSLGEHASSPVSLGSSEYVSSSATSVASQPYAPVNPADFGATDTTPQEIDGSISGQAIKPTQPLSPQEIIELNDRSLQREEVEGVRGVQGGEYTAQA